MATTTQPMELELTWDGDLRFAGRSHDVTIITDGDRRAGPSPTQLVAYGLGGCMAIDVVNILVKGRHPVRNLRVRLTAHRADARPPRFTAFDLHFVVSGQVPAGAVERAIQLSRDTYCSVWHSLRQDIELRTSIEIVHEQG
jgi:putative redox protein